MLMGLTVMEVKMKAIGQVQNILAVESIGLINWRGGMKKIESSGVMSIFSLYNIRFNF